MKSESDLRQTDVFKIDNIKALEVEGRGWRGQRVGITYRFSDKGAVDNTASHICVRYLRQKSRIRYHNTTDLPPEWRGSKSQYNPEMGANVENRECCEEEAASSCKNSENAENIAAVREAMKRSLSRSARRHARELQSSRDSVRRILRLDLKFHAGCAEAQREGLCCLRKTQ
ncbi:hypothetical protein QE152_g30148 [Popillia japonica]|uniref:Uncharacterized protein n=1 Tax=Popillia japonica TaxID=7064 RepID=A0AAW1JFK7_POPJA